MADFLHKNTPTEDLHPAGPLTRVRVAITTNGTLASAYENGDSASGVTLATNDRILLGGQTAGAENGIRVVAASGVPPRATDFDTAADMQRGLPIYVEEGTYAGHIFIHTTAGTITVDTTALTFVDAGGAGGIDVTLAGTTTLTPTSPAVSPLLRHEASDGSGGVRRYTLEQNTSGEAYLHALYTPSGGSDTPADPALDVIGPHPDDGGAAQALYLRAFASGSPNDVTAPEAGYVALYRYWNGSKWISQLVANNGTSSAPTVELETVNGTVKVYNGYGGDLPLILDGLWQLKAITAPAGSPPSGYQYVYIDAADGHLKRKTSGGVVTDLG